MNIEMKEKQVFNWIGGKSPDPQRILKLAKEIIDERGVEYTPFCQKLWNQMIRKGLLPDLLDFALKNENIVFLKTVSLGQFDPQQDPLMVFLEHEKISFVNKLAQGINSEHDYWDEKWPYFEDVLDVLKRTKNKNIHINPKPMLSFLSVCGHAGINRRLVKDYTSYGLGLTSTIAAENIRRIPHADVFFNWWDSGLDWRTLLLVENKAKTEFIPADALLWKAYYQKAEELNCLLKVYEKIYEGEESKEQAIKILLKLNLGVGTPAGNQASIWLKDKMVEWELAQKPYWNVDFIEFNGCRVENFMGNDTMIKEKKSFQQVFESKINNDLREQLQLFEHTKEHVKKVQPDVIRKTPSPQRF